jgi:hypothetical protein
MASEGDNLWPFATAFVGTVCGCASPDITIAHQECYLHSRATQLRTFRRRFTPTVNPARHPSGGNRARWRMRALDSFARNQRRDRGCPSGLGRLQDLNHQFWAPRHTTA